MRFIQHKDGDPSNVNLSNLEVHDHATGDFTHHTSRPACVIYDGARVVEKEGGLWILPPWDEDKP
jgi:hypothetical protein